MNFDENNPNQNPSTGTGGLVSPTENEPESMPLGLSEDSFDDFSGDPRVDAAMDQYAYSGRGKGGFLLILVLLCVAGAVLWTMRKTGGVLAPDTATAATEKQIDQALAKLQGAGTDPGNINSLFADIDKIVDQFEVDPSQKQVPIDYVQKNPFELHNLTNQDTDKKGDTPANSAERARAARLKSLQDELSKMNLQSIITGKDNIAMITGKVVRAGNRVGNFKVTTIHPQVVELEALIGPNDKVSFSLKLKSPKKN